MVPDRQFRKSTVTESTDDVTTGLWQNGRDSITHALHHFSERRQDPSNQRHHDKWIVLSVHHAAECVCNMRLIELDSSQIWRNGRLRFPSPTDAINVLQRPILAQRLSAAEDQLFRLFSRLTNSRNEFMHRTGPKQLDVSIAAMCMIGILKYIERGTGETASGSFGGASWTLW
jgi:hypothetical protein